MTCIESACVYVAMTCTEIMCVCVYVYVSNDAKRERVRVCVYDVHRECVMARLLARLR